MKRNIGFLILIVICLLCSLIACNNGAGRIPEEGDEGLIKYPMSQLPKDLLEPDNYEKVTDDYAEGFKVFQFSFKGKATAANEKERLGKDLKGKGYSDSIDSAEVKYQKGETIVILRQSVKDENSILFISIPYDFIVTCLPEEFGVFPLFNGCAYNIPEVKAVGYGEYEFINLVISYFNVNFEDGFAFSRYLELNDFPKYINERHIEIATDESELNLGKFKVTYSIAGFTSEPEWREYKEKLAKFNFEKARYSTLQLDSSEYMWIDKGLEKMGYPSLIGKPRGNGKIKFHYEKNFDRDGESNDEMNDVKASYKVVVSISNLIRDYAFNYVDTIMSQGWQDVPYIDNEEKTKWSVEKEKENFDVIIRYGLLIGRFSWKENIFKMELQRISPNINKALMDKCGNFTVVYQFGKTAEYTSIGDNYAFSTTQNGGLVGRFASPIFDSSKFFNLKSREESSYADAFKAYYKMTNKTFIENDTYIEKEVKVYEGKYNGEESRIYVDSKYNITLKIVDSTEGVIFKVNHLEFT